MAHYARIEESAEGHTFAARLVALRNAQQSAQQRVEPVDLLQDRRQGLAPSLGISGDRTLCLEPHGGDRVTDLMGDAGGDAADCSQTLSDLYLTRELVGSLPRRGEAMSGFIERRHDPVELALTGDRQPWQLCNIVCLKGVLDLRHMS